MSKGALVFARNNAQVDYVKQAHFLAKRIKKYLNIGTTVVTDSKDYLITNYPDWGSVWDRVIEIPFSQSATTKRYYDGSGVFKTLEFKKINKNKKFIIYDLRNLYNLKEMKNKKIKYFSIGRTSFSN